MKRRIRLTESDLHRIVKESMKRILREANFNRREMAHQMAGGLLDPNYKEGPGYRETLEKQTPDHYWVDSSYAYAPMTNGNISRKEQFKRADAYKQRDKYNNIGVKHKDKHPEIMQKQMEREKNAFSNLDPLEVRKNAYDLAYNDNKDEYLYKLTQKLQKNIMGNKKEQS